MELNLSGNWLTKNLITILVGASLSSCAPLAQHATLPSRAIAETDPPVLVKNDLPTAGSQSAGMAPMEGEQGLYVKLAKQVVPSVVNISTITLAKGGGYQGSPEDMFRRF